jgi:RNA polymerase sigma-70 factor (ECF subfamily)
MNDDFRLIDEVLAGESQSFSLLVDRYQSRLQTSLSLAIGDRDVAEDVTQDAFLQAYVQLHRFQRTCAFYTWLYRIAFNLAGTLARKNRPCVSLDRCIEAGREPLDDGQSPSEILERQEVHEAVHAALTRLNQEHRQILQLRELEGCEYDTVARRLDIPLGTVRSRLFRARAKMREQFEG